MVGRQGFTEWVLDREVKVETAFVRIERKRSGVGKMKSWKWLLVLLGMIVATPAFGVVIPGQPNGGEPYLYAIYNQIYGTNYSSNNDAAFLALQTGWETLVIDSDVESITFDALWRQSFLTDNFGYYVPSQQKMPANMTNVLGPFDNSGVNQGQGAIAGSSFVLDTTGLSEIGFYDHATLPGDPNTGFFWYSQSFLNDGQFQTTPGEIHVLILATSNPDVFLLCFEDLPYNYFVDDTLSKGGQQVNIGDQDYQDLLVQITLNRTVIPEPTSLALLGMGLAGIAAVRMRRRAA